MTQTKASNDNGVILHETDSIVVIANGIVSDSTNRKTGAMIQVWILAKAESPVQAVKSGLDEIICGDCIHRGDRMVNEAGQHVFINRRCYVNVGQAPTSVYNAWKRGVYRHIDASEYQTIFGNREVRLGAYGDPVHIPLAIIAGITAVAKRHTGYTHQWRNEAFAGYREYIMASCDSDRDSRDAKAQGWRRFRVRAVGDASIDRDEIVCPASDEGGNKTQCIDCGLCNGVRYENDPRKNITIIDHSRIANKVPLIQIQ